MTVVERGIEVQGNGRVVEDAPKLDDEVRTALQAHYPSVIVGDWEAYNGLKIRNNRVVGGFMLVEVFPVAEAEAVDPPIKIDDTNRPFPEHIIARMGERALINGKTPHSMVREPGQRRPKRPIDISSH